MVALLGLALQVRGASGDHVELVVHPVADEASRLSVRGTPSTRASMLAPKVCCSWECLYRLFSTTFGTASRFRTSTRRWPVRPEVRLACRRCLDLAVAHGFADGDDETIRIDLVGQFGDHQAHAAVDLLGVDHGAHGDEATSGAVGLFDALVAEDGGAGGEVRSLDDADQVFQQFLAAASGWSSAQWTPSATSRMLCGGMLVAMPTAMPAEPLTSRFGKRAGSTVGSWVLPS